MRCIHHTFVVSTTASFQILDLTSQIQEWLVIITGRLGLGTYQSVLMLELDGPRTRQVLCHVIAL
jgi:thiamine phosphate synthase YjbQ (UPF0047 family)